MAGFKQRTIDFRKQGYRGFGAIKDVSDAIAFIAGPGAKQMVRRAAYKIGLEMENELKKYPKSPSQKHPQVPVQRIRDLL